MHDIQGLAANACRVSGVQAIQRVTENALDDAERRRSLLSCEQAE